MEYNFLFLAITYFLGIAVPGPSLFLIIRNGLIHTRLASFLASAGIMIGIALQAGGVLIGITLIKEDSIIFKFLLMISSVYLIYLGFCSLIEDKSVGSPEEIQYTNLTKWKYLKEGFWIEFLNPIAFSFFMNLFTFICNDIISWHIKTLYWIEIIFIGSIWFFSISYLSSSKEVKYFIESSKHVLKVTGGLLFIFFGIMTLFKNFY